MKQCILHVGMPKTGTSAIQESLYYGLADPAFRYIGLGQVNHAAAMAALFGDTPEKSHVHRRMGRSAQQVAQYRVQLLHKLDKHLATADADVQSILSAEYCWGMRGTQYERIREFMAERGYTVRVIAYVRSWKEWLESCFQQRIKAGDLSSFQVSPANHSKIDYRERIETLESVFGSEHVQVYKYDPSTFPEGCVVRHFCQQAGIHFDAGRIRRANDSLKLPAIQLLYAYRKFGPGHGTGATAAQDAWLNQRLRELRGPALRFHSSTVEPVISNVLPQIPWLEQRLGLPFTEDLARYDQGACIRTESDLFDFDPAVLAWLAAATHSRLARPAAGEDAARAVAAQMHTLRRSVPARVRMRRLVRGAIARLRRWRV
ncbi:MAG: hypothetical protein IAE81_21255 [Caldilineaceae bacterium]|nr:hypothetical protein [Caldilineaceae bacterium]